jgi:coenzyme F420 hydrogenase subunit beta
MNFNDIPPKLCNYCGACVFVCPKKCLSINQAEKIKFDVKECIDCGLCVKNCQGISFDFPKMQKHFFQESKFDEEVGNYQEIYIGQSKNQEVLKKSSSGGIITTIIISAFRKKIINSVIFVAKDPNNPFGYKPMIARSEEEFLNNRTRSLYRIVSMVQILKEIKPEDKNLAFIGLPCHIEAVRTLQANGNALAKKITLNLGIFCGLNQSVQATNFLVKKTKVKKEHIKELGYRGPGWPGGFHLIKTNNQLIKIDKDTVDFTNYLFILPRCLLCYDFTNEFADISVGDAWSKLPSKAGWSEIIVRTKLGEEIINNIREEFVIQKSSLKTLKASHPGNFSFKKKGIFYRFKNSKHFPKINVSPPKLNFKTKVFSYLYFLFIRRMGTKLTRKIALLIPLKLFGKSIFVFKQVVRFILVKRR